MVAGSILPVALHNNELYFLFGKENPLEDSAKGWSDFGGGVEKGETPFKTALREGSEELTGFLGDSKELAKHIKKHGGFHHFEQNNYHIHVIVWEYDENLVKYYNHNHSFLWKRMDKHLLSKTKLFEKIEIGWFSVNDILQNKIPFRFFYKEHIEKMLREDGQQILDFVKKNTIKLQRHNRTIKQRKT
jgi:8-oxo-dGTP pyrophosphatase MutT (NUDIX family)